MEYASNLQVPFSAYGSGINRSESSMHACLLNPESRFPTAQGPLMLQGPVAAPGGNRGLALEREEVTAMQSKP